MSQDNTTLKGLFSTIRHAVKEYAEAKKVEFEQKREARRQKRKERAAVFKKGAKKVLHHIGYAAAYTVSTPFLVASAAKAGATKVVSFSKETAQKFKQAAQKKRTSIKNAFLKLKNFLIQKRESIKESIQQTKQRVDDAVLGFQMGVRREIRDNIHAKAQMLKDGATNLRINVQDAADKIKDNVHQAVNNAKTKVQDAAILTGLAIGDKVNAAKTKVQDAAILTGLAIGDKVNAAKTELNAAKMKATKFASNTAQAFKQGSKKVLHGIGYAAAVTVSTPFLVASAAKAGATKVVSFSKETAQKFMDSATQKRMAMRTASRNLVASFLHKRKQRKEKVAAFIENAQKTIGGSKLVKNIEANVRNAKEFSQSVQNVIAAGYYAGKSQAALEQVRLSTVKANTI